jgi:hypothetical protein
MTTQRRWRAWLTNHLLDRWLKNGRCYQLNLVTGDHKNPEYLIADDVRDGSCPYRKPKTADWRPRSKTTRSSPKSSTGPQASALSSEAQ